MNYLSYIHRLRSEPVRLHHLEETAIW